MGALVLSIVGAKRPRREEGVLGVEAGALGGSVADAAVSPGGVYVYL